MLGRVPQSCIYLCSRFLNHSILQYFRWLQRAFYIKKITVCLIVDIIPKTNDNENVFMMMYLTYLLRLGYQRRKKNLL